MSLEEMPLVCNELMRSLIFDCMAERALVEVSPVVV